MVENIEKILEKIREYKTLSTHAVNAYYLEEAYKLVSKVTESKKVSRFKLEDIKTALNEARQASVSEHKK